MHDIKTIRTQATDFTAEMLRRGIKFDPTELLALDQSIRASKTEAQAALMQRKALSEQYRLAKAQGRDASEISHESNRLSDVIQGLETSAAEAEVELRNRLLVIPNILAADVPYGENEHANVCIHEHVPHGWNEKVDAVPHYELDVGLDFEAGARLSGSRFTVLRGAAAKLHRALGQFMLDTAAAAEYGEIIPPVLVNSPAMVGTGQLPKFEEDAYQTGEQWLIPTAEVSLTNLVANQILDEDALPLRMTALTQCFRQEAGSAGRDTRGFLRQHQFEKVELVTICAPEQSLEEHERIMETAETVLERLDLKFRRVLLCSGDTGFSAAKTYDLEVWMEGSKEYREISSCSNCHDFQSRRMGARMRRNGTKGTEFPHTLNGSALAVGRALVAVLEAYQTNNAIVVPDSLRLYLGTDRFEAKRLV